MRRYHLTALAEDDLRAITRYTLEAWGVEEVRIYRDRLEARLNTLARFPELGRSHVRLPEHILYVVEGKHYVFYRVADDGIEVVRFLHTRMEVWRHLAAHL